MELGLLVDVALVSLYTIFLITLSVDEARGEKRVREDRRIKSGSEDSDLYNWLGVITGRDNLVW